MGKTSETIKAFRDNAVNTIGDSYDNIYISNRNVFEAVDANLLQRNGTALVIGRTSEAPGLADAGGGAIITTIQLSITILVALKGRSCEGKEEEERTLLLYDLSDEILSTFTKSGQLQSEPGVNFAGFTLASVFDQIDVLRGNFIATTFIYNVSINRANG